LFPDPKHHSYFENAVTLLDRNIKMLLKLHGVDSPDLLLDIASLFDKRNADAVGRYFKVIKGSEQEVFEILNVNR
jgi:hypothetical protein